MYLKGKFRCGIVALCMALNSLNINCKVDILMNRARELNYSKSGEIFDSKHYESSFKPSIDKEKRFLKILLVNYLYFSIIQAISQINF
ncbi:hypothetical protein BpHYR1_053436 [Brachionus plicatilis]|uniref:Uncharacterized protein n=1 Tax=Brachionus plicatilis TaxID=10195 RepID=A0A3M7QHZ7_BRAPC|nr:hypothetical protein BpHYR1_053436 [Brachionus plicatilis]